MGFKRVMTWVLVLVLVVSSALPANLGEAKAKIRLNKKSITLSVGKKVKLKVKGTTKKTSKKVIWKTKNKKIATVSKKGVVKAKKVGKTKIIAKTGKKKLVCKVVVKKTAASQSDSQPSEALTVPAATLPPDQAVPATSTPGVTPVPQETMVPQETAVPQETEEPDDGIFKAPVFSKESGAYDDAFDLKLRGAAGSTIYYTTDGSIPLSAEEKVAEQAKPTSINLEVSAANEEFKSSTITSQYEDNAGQLSFAKQYDSLCYKAPEGATDWSKYATLEIDYTVEQIGNGGTTLGLQICPIYASATGSWVEVDGKDTARISEARRELTVGSGTISVTLNQDEQDYSSVGRLMLGVFNETADQEDKITIRGIRLMKSDASDGIPAKLATNTYEAPIRVKNRQGEANVLCSPLNTPYMYHPDEVFNGTFDPEVSAVPKATVIRAMAVDADGVTKSEVVTKVYFVGNELSKTYEHASVISVVTDPDNLLDKEIGIYRYGNWDNSGSDWERPADVTYLEEDGSIPFETRMGIRIHGGYSRRWGQKSFRLYFRDELGGLKNLKDYELIPGATNFDKTEPTKKFKNFMLRNGGNDYALTKMQDVFTQSLVEDRAYTTQSSRPCVLFLNGEYWGLYNLTERYSDNYLETEFDVDKDNVIVYKNGELDEGVQDQDEACYEAMQTAGQKDMTDADNYAAFTSLVDMESLIDYYATEVYIGNKDWPANNVQLWRTRTDDGTTYGDTKWRWMLFDTEYAMNLYNQDIGNSITNAQTDPLFASLCDNETFKGEFIATLNELMTENFEPVAASKKLDEMAAIYRPLMSQYFDRFGSSIGSFDNNITRIKTFIQERPKEIEQYINESFRKKV